MVQTIPQDMLACQVVEYSKPYKIQRVPVQHELQDYEILVKVAVSGFCHTDQMVRQGIFRTKLPCTASHEGAGTVVAVGSSVKNFDLGDRLMCPVVTGLCGECSECTGPENRRQYCGKQKGAPGITRDGMFAEYAVVDSRTAAKVPDSVSFQTAAPLACAGCTIWRGIIECDLKPGSWLAIVGSGGGVGHIGIKFAKAMGLRVIGIDARDQGLEVTRSAGADITVDAREGQRQIIEKIQQATQSDGVDATINVSDAADAAGTACAITKKHGTMVQIAQPETVSIPFPQIVFRDIHVKGSLMCSPDEMKDMLAFVAEHKITVDTVAFHGLDSVPELLEVAHQGKLSGKAIVIVDPEQS
ncbi:chaperonin 10-like protein [Ilyonectria sp. MPI-CAGE-AT-0026]|nr:chaperonin 10-like protein [Ilyonectria sp. MPI-CAGE-AT-0026]